MKNPINALCHNQFRFPVKEYLAFACWMGLTACACSQTAKITVYETIIKPCNQLFAWLQGFCIIDPDCYFLQSSRVSLAIISSSFVGITRNLSFASSFDMSISTPRFLFFSSSIAAPRKSKCAAQRVR